MTTPIVDFAKRYANSDAVRLHMPGHKGNGGLCAALDITEIDGADSLYEADGIIRESELNASSIFGAHTFYSTEGSSLSIRAAIYLIALYARHNGKRPVIAAGRNAHKTFLLALSLTGADVMWLCPKESTSYLSCPISAEYLSRALDTASEMPTAVYITSPDYLGSITDIRSISKVCRERNILLIVDNAHGAYLKFCSPSLHPIDLGADISCDSAHKTLPCLTGAAYLHISKNAPSLLIEEAKNALAMFGSTSPSYLILQSLDAANPCLVNYGLKLSDLCRKLDKLKISLTDHGYTLVGEEPLKITVKAKEFGYAGIELYSVLKEQGIVCEFADTDHLVMMFTPENTDDDIARTEAALLSIKRKTPLMSAMPKFTLPKRVLSPREAAFLPREKISVDKCEGRILAAATVACPPAVPIAVSGEIINKDIIELFKYYGINEVTVTRASSFEK